MRSKLTGASSGFGATIAAQFVEDGYRVVGTSPCAPSKTQIAADGLTMAGWIDSLAWNAAANADINDYNLRDLSI
ncbi:MAG: hypothetical protein ABJP34_02585 [Erythrobacter sp.]